jgi:hypothetical protein
MSLGCLVPSRRHFAAALGALPAGLGTFFHWRVIFASDLFATASTPLAGFSANPTGVRVQRRTTKHEIGGREADLSAILHQADVMSFRMLAGLLQAILNGVCANGVTLGAVINTGLNACLT